jgi:hypothetical protein
MRSNGIVSLAIALWAAALAAPAAQAEPSLPDLSGTYRCKSDTRPCQSPTFQVTQSGGKLQVKAENGDIGNGEVTSDLSVDLGPPWNALGIILPDKRTIEWAAGTRWRRL